MLNLIDIASPNYLLVADEPISTDNSVFVHTLSLNEIKAHFFGFEYCENIVKEKAIVFAPFVEQHKQYDSYFEDIVAELRNRLTNPLNDALVICHIDDEVGYGVFAKEKIKPGIIALYAGKLEASETEGSYGVEIGPSHENLRINAEHMGGITRFIQHMPQSLDALFEAMDRANKEDFIKMAKVYDIYFPPEQLALIADIPPNIKEAVKDKITATLQKKSLFSMELKNKPFLRKVSSQLATANTRFNSIFIDNIPYVYVEAIRPIEVGEQLGISYGDKFWQQKQKVPRYFDKNTRHVIPKESYLPSLETILLKYRVENKEHALRRAVYCNDLNEVSILLEYGAQINEPSLTGKTPLSLAKTSQMTILLQECGARASDATQALMPGLLFKRHLVEQNKIHSSIKNQL